MAHANQPFVVVDEPAEQHLVVVEETRLRVVEVVAPGPQGPPPINNGEVLGHLPVSVSDVTAGDVIVFDGFAWVNQNKKHISDGGNF